MSRIEKEKQLRIDDYSNGVFISYLLEDYPVASYISNIIKNKGLKVCYDKTPSFDNKELILKSKIVIMLISNRVLDSENADLLSEWKTIVQLRLFDEGRLKILPVFVDRNVNRLSKFGNIIPEEIQKITGIDYHSKDFDSQIERAIEFLFNK